MKPKKDIIAELEKLGVEFDEEATAKDLLKLLKKAQKEKEAEEEEGEEEEKEEEEEHQGKGKFKILDSNGALYPRTFSSLKAAEKFAKGIGGRVKK